MISLTKRKPRPKVTYRQEDGDDGYCYCVRVNGQAVTYASLTLSEAKAEKARILSDWEKRNG